jgi:hypothetical protein
VKELMKRFTILITLAAALLLSGCGGGSNLPVATGKASIRAINGIKTAPDVGFLIEERTLGSASYRQITAISNFDDLSYNFNFDVFYAGDLQTTRVASIAQDIVKDMDYIFVLTGTIADPSILVWETPEREFTGTETVFEARFAHTAASLGSVDYYFAAPGIDPAAGEEAGTLAFGEVMTSIDFEGGEYVLTVTAGGMPDQVLYESVTTTFSPAAQYIISTFDGDANTFAPVVARATAAGTTSIAGTITMPDVNYPPTVEFVNGSLAIDTVDIYEDALLNSQIVAGHAYKDVSAELELAFGENPVLYTPATLLSPVLIDDVVEFFGGFRGRVVAYGPLNALEIRRYLPERRSIETQASLHLFNAAINFNFLNVYVVDADESIDGKLPTRAVLPSGVAASVIGLTDGSFDIYVTAFNNTEILAGPIRIDVVLGDALGGMIFDTDDPAVLEINFLPSNP